MTKQHVVLTASEKTYLRNLLSKGSLPARKFKRAQALLELNEGKTFKSVSDSLSISYVCASNWAKSYRESGFDFLDDKPRSGRPLGLNESDRAKITALACSEPPVGYSRWSLRLLANKLVELEIVDSISFKHVSNILKKMNCSLTEKNNGASER